MTYIEDEIASQPECWVRAAELARTGRWRGLPEPGERVAVIGCGTSQYMAQAYARLREDAGHGVTDAFPASEFPAGRDYDRVVAISRSGTTTEILTALDRIAGPTVAITTSAELPVAELAKELVVLDFADERSVVQTRFATSTLAFLRALLGADLAPVAEAAAELMAEPLPEAALTASQFTFLGTGWTVGIANEAGLKLREAAQQWTESYPAMEYRHGPISISDSRSLVWMFGRPPAGLIDEVTATGAGVHLSTVDAMADLVRVHRLAVARATAAGLDPDQPRNLGRSVILG